MPVKDGQVVNIEVEQRDHLYSREELGKIITKFNPNLPYDFSQLKNVIHKMIKEQFAEPMIEKLSMMRMDIKNTGAATNAVSVIAEGAKIAQPRWLTDDKGGGVMLESAATQQKLTLTAVKDGQLVLSFRGADCRDNGKRFPLWIDYKSIKIDGKEILTEPVATWHDKPYRYEMPVKDGQTVTVEIEQTFHPYTLAELEDVIMKLNLKSDYIISNLKLVTKVVYDLMRHRMTFNGNKQ